MKERDNGRDARSDWKDPRGVEPGMALWLAKNQTMDTRCPILAPFTSVSLWDILSPLDQLAKGSKGMCDE